MRKFYVYVLFHPDFGFPIYVGKGCRYRIGAHRSDFRCNEAKARFMRDALERGVDVPAVKVRADLSESEAFAAEVALISAIGRAPNGPLLNADDGGRGGRNPSPETRARIAEAARIAMTGRKFRPETILKMRAAAARRGVSPEHIARMNAAAKASPKVKAAAARLGASKKGVPHSPEHTAKIKIALAGRKPALKTTEARKAAAAARRAAKPRLLCETCRQEFLPRRALQTFCCKSCSATATAMRRNIASISNEGRDCGA